MRKLIYIIAMASSAALFTSCNKSYTCTCVVSQPKYAPQIVSTPIDKMSQGDAQYKCDVIKADFTARGLSSDCHI